MASIKCGQCHGTHGSVLEVRACYNIGPVALGVMNNKVVAAQEDQWGIQKACDDHARDKAVYAEREAAQERAAYTQEMHRDDAQRYGRVATTDHPAGVVATLRELRAAVKADMHSLFPTVRSLRVAARLPGEGDKVRFFQINVPVRGNWAGKVFVKEQASDDFYAVRSMDRQVKILQQVTRDLMESVALYGQELGECGMCHRTLTDEESRARGIGPICINKTGAA